MAKNAFIERVPHGSYAVEKPRAARASAILLTQREAIERAKGDQSLAVDRT